MATNTPILGLKKPVPNVEENWAFRLNESLDILDQSLLVGNASSKDNVTTFNDGVGHLVISGSTNPVFDHVETITFNAPYITVTTGTFTEINVGGITNILGTEITTTSGIFDEVVIAGVPLTAGTPTDHSFTLGFVATDRKASNTDGGTFTSGAWRVRTINSVDSNKLQGASLSSNTVTLTEPGDYYVEWSCPAYRVNRHKSILYNTTDSHTQFVGSNEYAGSGYLVQSISVGSGKFTIDKSTSFQIWHRCESSFNTQGLGVDSNFGVDEIYTQIRIWPADDQTTTLTTLVAASGIFYEGLTISGSPVVTGTHTVIPDDLATLSGTFSDALTVSGTPVTIGLSDPLTVTSGTFTSGLNVPHGITTSGNTTGDFWIDPTTSGLRWEFNGVVFEAQGIEVV